MSEPRQIPMLFSGPMVRAILEGRKTQTRRVVKLPRHEEHDSYDRAREHEPSYWQLGIREFNVYVAIEPPCRPGDLIYVKEPWAVHEKYDGCMPSQIPPGLLDLHYLADGPVPKELGGRYRHARFMMRYFARLWLRVVSVRAERLQEISEEDARAEGLFEWLNAADIPHYGIEVGDVWERDPRKTFKRLWDSTYGPGAWDRNPWVWRIEFDRSEKP